jgi:hypothetical protein
MAKFHAKKKMIVLNAISFPFPLPLPVHSRRLSHSSPDTSPNASICNRLIVRYLPAWHNRCFAFVINHPAMFQNHLRIALRHLLKNKHIAAINVAGLAIGIATCLVIALVVQHELSYDRYHEKSGRIYRLAFRGEEDVPGEGMAKVGGPWGSAAKAGIPGVAYGNGKVVAWARQPCFPPNSPVPIKEVRA